MRLALIGGEEFADGFEAVHAALLSPIANGKSRGVFLPTAAAEDGLNTVNYWRDLARERLMPYSAQVDSLLVIDRQSANDPKNEALIAAADWIYLGGGKPHVAMGILSGTLVLNAIIAAADRSVPILGASAGAMMMCAQSFVITGEFSMNAPPLPLACLGFVPNSVCAPHFNRSYAQRWTRDGFRPAGFTVIGIDEQTALSNFEGSWQVSGKGSITLIKPDGALSRILPGQPVDL